MVYPYEQSAMRGDELPGGLASCDIFMFLCLRELYKQRRLGLIDREQGSREKRKLEAKYSNLRFMEDHLTASKKLWKRIESAVYDIKADDIKNHPLVKNLLTAIYGKVFKDV